MAYRKRANGADFPLVPAANFLLFQCIFRSLAGTVAVYSETRGAGWNLPHAVMWEPGFASSLVAGDGEGGHIA